MSTLKLAKVQEEKDELKHKRNLAWQYQISALEHEFADKRRKEYSKGVDEVIAQELRRSEKEMDLQDEIAKVQTELDFQGLERRLKLLDIEKEAAIRKADVEAGEIDMIEQLFGARRRLEVRRGETLSSQVAFNPWAISGMMGGPLPKIEENTRDTARLMKRLERMFQAAGFNWGA